MMIFEVIWHWFTSWVIGWGGIGALVMIASWGLWYFTPAILADSKHVILQIAIASTVFTFASTYFYTSGYNTGYATAIQHIASQNKEASDAVKKAISKVDSCNSSGGTWDTVSGLCRR